MKNKYRIIDSVTAEVELTHGHVCLVDVDNLALIGQYRWCAMVGRKTYYAITNTTHNGKRSSMLMHQLLLEIPPGYEGDHINRNGLDNRRSNLRVVTRSVNARNSDLRATNTSGHTGIAFESGKWRVRVVVDYNTVNLGRFANLDDAISVRNTFLRHKGLLH